MIFDEYRTIDMDEYQSRTIDTIPALECEEIEGVLNYAEDHTVAEIVSILRKYDAQATDLQRQTHVACLILRAAQLRRETRTSRAVIDGYLICEESKRKQNAPNTD
jgi:hypothetical protein